MISGCGEERWRPGKASDGKNSGNGVTADARSTTRREKLWVVSIIGIDAGGSIRGKEKSM
jgi:hypothetical protein